MTELREVFEMTTKQVEPDLDSWRQLEERRRGARRNRRLGALILGAALSIMVVIALVLIAGGRTRTQGSVQPAGDSSGAVQPPPPPVSAVGRVPDTDYLLNVRTGEMTPLPASIVGTRDRIYDCAASPDGRNSPTRGRARTARARSSSRTWMAVALSR